MSFGKDIKEIRLNKNMTLDDLSKGSGLSKGYLSKLENGHRGTPKTDTILKLSKGLDFPYMELLYLAGYIEEVEKYKAMAKAAANVNKSKSVKQNNVINPEKFPDPINIKKTINVPSQYVVNGENREFDNKDLLDLYYLIHMGMDKNNIIELSFKDGEPIEKEKLNQILDLINQEIKKEGE